MLPYLELRSLDVAGVHVHVFGVLLVAAVVTGHTVLVRRARRMGLGPARVVERFAMVVVASALVPGLAVAALLDGGALDGLALSSLPALAGALVGAVAFVWLARVDAARFGDAAGYAFPFGWLVARTGCALVHDHVGRPSDSWLAVRFPDGPRFDLGVLEAAGTLALIALVVLLAASRVRAGVLGGSVVLAYGLLRLALEPLRGEGASHAPAVVCWLAVAVLGAGLVAWRSRPPRQPRRRDADGGADPVRDQGPP